MLSLQSCAVGALAVFLLVGQAAAGPQISRQIVVTDDFVENEITWSNHETTYRYRLKVIAVDGRLELCGAGQHLLTRRSQTMAVLRSTWLEMNGRKIVPNLLFLAEVPRKVPLLGAQANCVATNEKVPTTEPSFRLNGATIARRME